MSLPRSSEIKIEMRKRRAMTSRPEGVGQVGHRIRQIVYEGGLKYSRGAMPLGPYPQNYPLDRFELVNEDGTPYVFPPGKKPKKVKGDWSNSKYSDLFR